MNQIVSSIRAMRLKPLKMEEIACCVKLCSCTYKKTVLIES